MINMNDVRALKQQPESTNRLKNIYQQSLEVLCDGKDGSTKAGNAQRRCASLPLRIDATNLQKRALEEAAKALTTLWNISGTRRARLQSRPV
jgi:hypothetical protein